MAEAGESESNARFVVGSGSGHPTKRGNGPRAKVRPGREVKTIDSIPD